MTSRYHTSPPKYHVLVLDVPAHGKSRPHTDFTYEDAAEAAGRQRGKSLFCNEIRLSKYAEHTGSLGLCHLVGVGYAGFFKANRDMTITGPVLLLIGEQDRLGKVRQCCEAWHKKTGYPLHVIENASHNANVDNPEAVNKIIETFCQSVNETKYGKSKCTKLKRRITYAPYCCKPVARQNR